MRIRVHGVGLGIAVAFVAVVLFAGVAQEPLSGNCTTAVAAVRAGDPMHWRISLPRVRKFIVQLLEDLIPPHP
jgi:hypothetical protein